MAQDRLAYAPTVGSAASRYLLGMRVDATSYPDATRRVLEWARQGDSRYVCVASMHGVMEAYDSARFREIINGADLVTPDGMPLVWGLRLLGVDHATRVYGPDLTSSLLGAAETARVPVGFYGGTPTVLARLCLLLAHQFPDLRIVFQQSPPFRPPTPEEDRATVEEINRSGARMLFVGLGVPKQERWMAEHVGRVTAVMIGVGAAVDFLAKVKPQAPRWMRNCGLEWSFRLCTEPRRLWRRYLRHGPRFVALLGLQLIGSKGFHHRPP